MEYVKYERLRERQIEQDRRLKAFAMEVAHIDSEQGMRKSFCIKTDTRAMVRKKEQVL